MIKPFSPEQLAERAMTLLEEEHPTRFSGLPDPVRRAIKVTVARALQQSGYIHALKFERLMAKLERMLMRGLS